MKKITFISVNGTRQTLQQSWLKTFFRRVVRFFLTGIFALAVVANSQTFSNPNASAAPSGGATSAKQDTAQTTLSSILTALQAALSVTFTNTTIAVTNVGTFAVQAASTLAAETTKIIGTVNIAAGQTIATTGTYFQATQPVSLAVAPTTPVTGTFFQASQPVQANNAGAVATTSTNTVIVPPTLTKFTQGATGLSVQQLNNAGRNARHFMLDAYTAAPAVEAMQSVVQWYGNAAVAGTVSPAVVPAGKALRLTSGYICTKSLATVGSAVVRVRVNTAGTAVLASPLVASAEAGSRAGATTVAMTGGLDCQPFDFPEGFEIPAGAGVGFSMAGYGPAGALALQGVTRFAVYGYEY